MTSFAVKNITNMVALWRCYGAEQRGNLWYSLGWPYRVWHDSLDTRQTVKSLRWSQLNSKHQLVTVASNITARQGQGCDLQAHVSLTLMHLVMPKGPKQLTEETDLELLKQDDHVGITAFVDMCSEGFGYAIEVKVLQRAAKMAGVKLGFLRVHGKRVATVLLYKQGTTLGVFQVTVPGAYRGKGYATEVMHHSMRWAQVEGVKLMTLQASEMGLNLYRRLGFQEEGSITFWRKLCTEYP